MRGGQMQPQLGIVKRFIRSLSGDLLDQLKGKKIFTTLDAKRGYWQIRVQKSSQEKTAFVTFDGQK